ncbi:MAG TPA: MFS transporter [Stellaceae bacterium]|nr:MFS transporter [Stellaceae bacterium]
MAFERLRQALGGLGNVGRALSHRNYRVYISGNSIQLTGTWLQRVSCGWLAWTLTHSGAWLGIMSMAEFLPVMFVAPLAGVMADRHDRVSIIRITQLIACGQAILLAILVSTGLISIYLLFALVMLLGINQGIAQPARLALIPTLVDRAALPSALAINSIVFNSARFIGPAIAGLLIAHVGIGTSFAVNALSYVAFQVSLANLRDIPPLPVREAQNALRASLEAFFYASRHPGIAPMLLLFCVTTIGTRGFVELFPGFADNVFHRGPQGLAMLTSTVGLGAIFGGSWMLIRSQINGLTTIVLANTLVMSLAIIAFTATDNFTLALPCVFIAGAAMVVTGIGAQTLIQASTDRAMAGRVMALYGMIFRAGPALGAVLTGTASVHFGLRLPLALGATVSCACWLLTLNRRRAIVASLEETPLVPAAAAPAERGA